MNKTENKTQGSFSNITEMQNLIKKNSVVEFANNLKALKQRLSVVGTKIVEFKKKNEKVEKPAEKPEVKVAAVVSAEKVTETSSEDLHVADRRRSGHHRQESLQRCFVVGLEKKQRSKKGLKYAESN